MIKYGINAINDVNTIDSAMWFFGGYGVCI